MTAGRVLVASVIAPHKLAEGFELAWLTHAEAMADSIGGAVDFFLAAEVDARGLEVYGFRRDEEGRATGLSGSILDRLSRLDGTVWTYSIDVEPMSVVPYEITGGDRYFRIATGRNMAIEYATRYGHTEILHLDSDTEPTPDCLPRLLEVGRPLVYGHVPTYGLDGPRLDCLWLPNADLRQHWSSAGFCLVSREVFSRVRWAWRPDDGLTDDPCHAADVELMGRALGQDWRAVTRHDVIGRHHPESIGPLEQRPGDRRLYR